MAGKIRAKIISFITALMVQMYHPAVLRLGFHADAGTLTNVSRTGTSGSYQVNSYTGEDYAADSNASMEAMLKDYYDTTLLENARVEMHYEQFAKHVPLPKGHNGRVEFRKWNTFKRADKLQEGVIPSGQKFGATSIVGSVDQYGTYTAVSDRLERYTYDPIIAGASEEMGASAAETQEVLIRDALYTGTNVMYCKKVTRASGAEADVTAEEGLVEDATYHCHLTPRMINRVRTQLRKKNVPMKNGFYFAVINPSVSYDLREDTYWIEAHKYAAVREIFRGEIGELHGIRFIEDSFAPIIRGADLDDGTNGYLTVDDAIAAATKTITVNETLVADALIGRIVILGGTRYEITDNGTDSITVDKNVTSAAANAKIYPGEGGADGIAIYATYVFGKDAFAIIDPEQGGLEMIYKSKKEIGGPLEQFSTVGYKFETNGATILYQERLLRVMSTSAYSDIDEAN